MGSLGSNVYVDRDVTFDRYPARITIGDNAVLKKGTHLCPCNESASISIGANTTVGYFTFIFASGNITVGDDCLLAPFVYIVDSDHGTARDLPINRQPNQVADVRIGNDVWVGTGARILKGVTVGDGAIIAAGALVSQSVAPYSKVAGVPAQKIGERT